MRCRGEFVNLARCEACASRYAASIARKCPESYHWRTLGPPGTLKKSSPEANEASTNRRRRRRRRRQLLDLKTCSTSSSSSRKWPLSISGVVCSLKALRPCKQARAHKQAYTHKQAHAQLTRTKREQEQTSCMHHARHGITSVSRSLRYTRPVLIHECI